MRSMAIEPSQTSFRSPWQNGLAERWVESCRRDMLDHVIPFNERHLMRLLSDYVRYYHDDRTHLGLDKQTPSGRVRSWSTKPVIGRASWAVCTIAMIAPPEPQPPILPRSLPHLGAQPADLGLRRHHKITASSHTTSLEL